MSRRDTFNVHGAQSYAHSSHKPGHKSGDGWAQPIFRDWRRIAAASGSAELGPIPMGRKRRCIFSGPISSPGWGAGGLRWPSQAGRSSEERLRERNRESAPSSGELTIV
jgi:hypothetical protein